MTTNATEASFVLEAAPGTDIWRKPGHDVCNGRDPPCLAPFRASPLTFPIVPLRYTRSGPMKKFLSARISFQAPWSEAYDQGGASAAAAAAEADGGSVRVSAAATALG